METNINNTNDNKVSKKTLKLRVMILPKLIKFVVSFEHGTYISKIKNKIQKILDGMKVTSFCDKLTNEDDYILLDDSKIEDVLNNEDKIFYYTKIQQNLLNKKRENENQSEVHKDGNKSNKEKQKNLVAKVETNSDIRDEDEDDEEYDSDDEDSDSHRSKANEKEKIKEHSKIVKSESRVPESNKQIYSKNGKKK